MDPPTPKKFVFSQEPVIGPYFELFQSSPHSDALFMAFWRSTLILSSDLCIGDPSGLFHLDFRIMFSHISHFRNPFYVFVFVLIRSS
jgi:hypothetical protein